VPKIELFNSALVLTRAYRTIHGMVYNAMKLFMEVNPGLFDDCSHEYTEQQNNADAVKAARQAKWDRLSQLAESMKTGTNGAATNGASARGNKVRSPMRTDDADPLAQGTERLRLGDDRERRPKEYSVR